MLQAMRQNMKVILWITIIFFVLLIFLVWGADLQFGGGPQPNVAGLVNGEPVSISVYQQLLAINRQDALAQGTDLQPSDELRIEEQTWDSMVNEVLLKQEAARRGLETRDAEVRAVLLNTPPAIITQNPSFQNAQGQFDMNIYRAFLQDPATPEQILLQLETYVRDSMPQQKLQEMVLSGAKVTEDELRRAYQEETESASITYVLVDGAGLEIDDTVTDEALQSYFDGHRDKYILPETVDLHYVSIPRVPSPEDSANLIKDLREFAQEAREAEARKAQGKEQLSDSDFATLAMTFSDLPNAEEGGLNPNYKTKNKMLLQQWETLSALEIGEICEPYEDAGFYYIAQLVDRKEEDGEQALQLAHLGLRIVPSDSTVFAVQERLEEIKEQARTLGLKATEGLIVREATNVQRDAIVPGLTGLPQASTFAHTHPQGTVSRVYSTNSAWYLLEVGEKHPGGPADLESVRSRVTSDLLRDRALQAGRAVADQISQQIAAGATLEDAAAAASLTATPAPSITRAGGIPGLGTDAQALGRVFSTTEGTVTPPVQSERGWVILRVDARPEMDWTAYETRKPALLQFRRNSLEVQLFNQFLEELREQAEIIDYRI